MYPSQWILIFSITQNTLFYSWIKIDQLDVTCFIISLFKAQRVSNVSTSILRSLRLICWVISWVVLLWGGVVSVCRLKPAYGYHTTPTFYMFGCNGNTDTNILYNFNLIWWLISSTDSSNSHNLPFTMYFSVKMFVWRFFLRIATDCH